MKTLNFITGNKNKLAEVKAILGDTVELHSRAVDVPEIQGTSEEIAREKCRRAAIEVSLDCYIIRVECGTNSCVPPSRFAEERKREENKRFTKAYNFTHSNLDRGTSFDRRYCT